MLIFVIRQVLDVMKKLFDILKLCAISVLVGVLGGIVSAAFAHLLSFVTELRQSTPWLLILLPLAAVMTTYLYRIFSMQDYGGANEIILCIANRKPIRVMAAPLIFVSGAITHLFGGSAGREGAALQLGGAGTAWLCRGLRLTEEDRAVVVVSGMGAVFAGLFGAPLTATVFVLEFRAKPKMLGLSLFPCLIASVVAVKISSVLGVAAEIIPLGSIAAFTGPVVLKILVLALGISLLGRMMCAVFHNAGHWAKCLLKNDYFRSALAAFAVVVLTAIVGDMRYNGSGMPMAVAAVEGKADWFDFLLKLIFTTLTLAAGLKGGEIVPTFCIGATFGCVFGSILGVDAGFFAALGLVGLFCCATNSPISGILLGVELFGLPALPYYILICLALWPISAKNGLFKNRIFRPIDSR